jgi:hypothetical protein
MGALLPPSGAAPLPFNSTVGSVPASTQIPPVLSPPVEGGSRHGRAGTGVRGAAGPHEPCRPGLRRGPRGRLRRRLRRAHHREPARRAGTDSRPAARHLVRPGRAHLTGLEPARRDRPGIAERHRVGRARRLDLFQTTVGYLAFYAGLQQGVSSTAAAVLSLLEPVAATVLAILLLGQHLAILAGAGIVILLTAVLLVREPDAAAHDHRRQHPRCLHACGRDGCEGTTHQSRGGNHSPSRGRSHRRARLRRDCTHRHGPAQIRRKRPVLTKRDQL